MRAWYASAEGQRQYAHPRGSKGPSRRGVRAFGLRRTRYWGLEKTHLQHVATGRSNQCRSDRGVARRASTGTNAHLLFRRACSRLRPTRQARPEKTTAALPSPVISSKSNR